MAEEFLTRNLQIPDEERESVKDSPSPSLDENIDIKMEDEGDEGESGSDIIIEEERYASRSSSPDIEVVKVLKSATRITVDLTKDDDDEDIPEFCECFGQSSAKPETSNAPILDLSSEENASRQPSSMHQQMEFSDSSPFTSLPSSADNTRYTHSQSHHQSFTDYPNGSNAPKVKQEDDDTISLIRDLESYASLPIINWRSSPVEPSDLSSTCDGHHGMYEKNLNDHPSVEMLTGSTSSVVISANDDRDKNPLLSGTAQGADPFSDAPLDMSVSNGFSLQKGTAAANSYSGYSSAMPFPATVNTSHTSSSSSLAYDGLNMNSAGSLLQKTEMIPTDLKSSMSSHPNSAFQAVTPSTSGNRIPDLVDFLVNHQSNTPSTSYSTGFNPNSCNQSDGIFGNPQNSWFTEMSRGVTSQSWESSVQNVLTQLSGSYSNQLPVYPNSNMDTAHPSYMRSPSTSDGNYNLGTKSDHSHKFSCGLPVLSPGTVIEEVGNNRSPSISNSLCFPSTSTSSSNDIPQKTISSGANVPQATANLRINTAGPPSPEEPTFSCNICLDSVKTIQSSSRNLCSTVCGHVFCSDCLQEALKKKKECPMCRKKLGKKQYHPLFL